MKASKLLPLVGVAIFLYIILNLDMARVLETLSAINLVLFLAGIGILFFLMPVKTAKWKILIHSYNIKCPFFYALKAWFVGSALGLITPGKVGDFGKSYYLKKNVGKGLTTAVVDRMIDVLVLFIMCIGGLGVFAVFYSKYDMLFYITLILFVAFLAAIVIFSKKSLVTLMAGPFYRRLVPEGHKTRLKGLYDDFYIGLDMMKKKKKLVLLNMLITFFVWGVTVLYSWVFALSLGLDIPFSMIFTTITIATLLVTLPISFSGLGTREAALVFFLSYVSIAPESAIALSLLLLIGDYIVAAPGFWFWYRNPIKLKNV